jgi:hypothetical protein
LVDEVWDCAAFAVLQGARPDAVGREVLESLARDRVPPETLARHVDLLIIPANHNRWLDLFCSSHELDANLGCLVASARATGLADERVFDEFV